MPVEVVYAQLAITQHDMADNFDVRDLTDSLADFWTRYDAEFGALVCDDGRTAQMSVYRDTLEAKSVEYSRVYEHRGEYMPFMVDIAMWLPFCGTARQGPVDHHGNLISLRSSAAREYKRYMLAAIRNMVPLYMQMQNETTNDGIRPEGAAVA